MKRATQLCLLAGAASIGVASLTDSACADDLEPPGFRNQPLSVFAEWEFATPPANWRFIPPDSFATTEGNAGELFSTGFATHAEVDLVPNWIESPNLIPYPGAPLGPVTVIDANHFDVDWIIIPNPDWELLEIQVPFGTLLDEVVIDTVATVPSPDAAAAARCRHPPADPAPSIAASGHRPSCVN